MESLVIIIIAIAALAVIIIGWAISVSNTFKRKKIKIDEALSGVEVALTNRYDKLTKLLDVAKGYMKHETETFTQVINLRKGMTAAELSESSAQCDQLAARINAVAEGYPELRSAEIFRELQGGIRDAEAHLQAARRLYNSNVTSYNTAIAMFPSSIVASSQRLAPAEFFTADEEKKSDVAMNFN